MTNEYANHELNTASVRTWTFNIDELDGFRLDAPQEAKSAVSEVVDDVRYRDLRAKLVNSRQFGDTYVTVVAIKDD